MTTAAKRNTNKPSKTPARGKARTPANNGFRKVQFKIQAAESSTVFLAGSFNDWDGAALPMKFDGGGFFSVTVPLPEGRHEYKFVIDGVWQIDPNCPQWVPNSCGTLNSVMDVV